MSIATAIQALQQAKADIASAIEDQGVDTTGHGLADYATDIKEIKSGGSEEMENLLLKTISAIVSDSDDTDLTDDILDLSSMGTLTIKSLRSYAFAGIRFQQVILPSAGSDSYTEIPNYCFNYSNLADIVIPEGITSIGNNAMAGCLRLSSVSLPSTLKTLQASVFSSTPITEIALPQGLLTIGNSCFANSGITELSIPDSVTEAGNSMCSGATSLVTAKIRCAKLGSTASNGAFKNCSALKYVWISSDCTTILGNSANYAPFSGCGSLAEFYCEAASKPSGWSNFWNYGVGGALTVHWGTTEEQFDAIVRG